MISPIRCRGDAARGSIEQSSSEMCFQTRDRFGHGGSRQVGIGCSSFEAATFHHAGEQAHAISPVHSHHSP